MFEIGFYELRSSLKEPAIIIKGFRLMTHSISTDQLPVISQTYTHVNIIKIHTDLLSERSS